MKYCAECGKEIIGRKRRHGSRVFCDNNGECRKEFYKKNAWSMYRNKSYSIYQGRADESGQREPSYYRSTKSPSKCRKFAKSCLECTLPCCIEGEDKAYLNKATQKQLQLV